MFRDRYHRFAAVWMLAASALVHAQEPASKAVPVTVDNFVRAESDRYMGDLAVRRDALGKFLHLREAAPADERQVVVRPNRDVMVSSAVFDLDAGPLTITLPDAGQRFRSMLVIDEDHHTPGAVYAPGDYTFTREKVGTRYITVLIRTLVDHNDPRDVQQVHALQDAIKVSQKSPGRFEAPNWDPVSQKRVREALVVLGETLPDLRHAFGTRQEVDPVRHLIGAAIGWGGNPDRDATYLNVTPRRNDGKTVHRLTIKDVPVDAFWSVALYNAKGYFEPNPLNAYTFNSITAKKSSDGSAVIQFGGCDKTTVNCLPFTPGWNYLVRLYRPRAEILDGRWTLPEAQPVQ